MPPGSRRNGEGEGAEEPSPGEAFKEIPREEPDEDRVITGVPVQEVIGKVAKGIRFIFRKVPDEIYNEIAPDPSMVIGLLQIIGCENEPIQFLGEIPKKYRQWIAWGSLGIFGASSILMVYRGLQRPEIQAAIRYTKMTPDQQADFIRQAQASYAEYQRQAQSAKEAEVEKESEAVSPSS